MERSLVPTLFASRQSNDSMQSLQPVSLLIVLAASLLAVGDAASFSKIKPKPVRAALERRYAEMRHAYFVRDSSVVLASRLPNFFSITPAGDTLQADAVRAYTRASFEQVQTTRVLEWRLGIIDLHGDTAAVVVDQHWVRRQLKGGAVRDVDTRARQRETWIRKDDQWLLWRIDNVRPGVWRVSGKRIDPSKPYDPSAPEYRPR
jgi:hypothetical protein